MDSRLVVALSAMIPIALHLAAAQQPNLMLPSGGGGQTGIMNAPAPLANTPPPLANSPAAIANDSLAPANNTSMNPELHQAPNTRREGRTPPR